MKYGRRQGPDLGAARTQTEFLRTAADICIYGGAAGGGKTVGLILEPLRHVGRVVNFTAVFFRRTTPQITNPGGLWDESQNFYPWLGGTPHLRAQEWRWPRRPARESEARSPGQSTTPGTRRPTVRVRVACRTDIRPDAAGRAIAADHVEKLMRR